MKTLQTHFLCSSPVWNSLLTYVYELPVMDHYVFYSELKLIEKKVYAGELIGRTLITGCTGILSWHWGL